MERKSLPKIVVSAFFILLLVIPYAIDKYEGWKSYDSKNLNTQDALTRYGFYLEEVSAYSDVNFTHVSPELDARLKHIMPEVASMGAAVSVTDFNNDGWQDFYLTNSKNGSLNALYKNLGNGKFEDVASGLGIASLNTQNTGASMGSVWADYDNDGYEDVFVYKWGKPQLFHNDQGKGFTEVSAKADLPVWVNSNAAIWFDYNRDGYVDLFMGGYYAANINLWHLKTTEIMPESFEYAKNGGRNYLLRNNGDGTFTEISREVGLDSRRWTLSVNAADLTGSGYPDLVIANDYGVDELYINEEGKRFRSAGEEAGMGFTPKSGMNVAYGDVMNQGKLSIYITNISEPGVLIQGNNLWVPGKEDQGLPTFHNLAGNLGIELGGWSYCGQFGDLNSDGYIDLYVANGYVSAEKGTDYWYDFSKIAGGNHAIIADAKNWPPMNGRSLSGYQKNKIWLNDGAGKFQEVADEVGGGLNLDSRSVAYADLWNQGALDIIVANQNTPVKIYKTHVTPDNHWIGFKLQGTKSNRSAIGTEVELYWNNRKQLQIVAGGSGFSSQNQRPLFFGLGKAPSVEKAVIKWPSGNIDTLKTPVPDQLHLITEKE